MHYKTPEANVGPDKGLCGPFIITGDNAPISADALWAIDAADADEL